MSETASGPMVCTICRTPVVCGLVTGLWFHSTDDPGRCSRTVPVNAMPADGNEHGGEEQ